MTKEHGSCAETRVLAILIISNEIWKAILTEDNLRRQMCPQVLLSKELEVTKERLNEYIEMRAWNEINAKNVTEFR